MLTSYTQSNSIIKSVFIFTLVALFLCFEMGVQVCTSVMTKPLMADLHLDAFGLGMVSGIYFFTYTIMQIPAGLLFDRFHVRNVLMLPLLLCAGGCFVFALAKGFWLGAVGRLLMGAGSAFAFIAVLVVATDIFSQKWFALLAGITQMLAALGAMAGEAPLVPFVESVGWRYTLNILGLIALILTGMIWIFVRYQPKISQTKIDTYGVWESLSLITNNPQTWTIALYACLLWAPMAGFASLWGDPYLQTALNVSNIVAASLLSWTWIGIAVGAPLIGWWSDYIENRKRPLMCCAVLGTMAFAMILLNTKAEGWQLMILLFFIGVSCAGQALSFASIRDMNPRQTIAAAIGFNNMAVVLAGAIFQPLIGNLIKLHWSGRLVDGSPDYALSDYQFGLNSIMISYVISIFACYLIRESRSPQSYHLEE